MIFICLQKQSQETKKQSKEVYFYISIDLNNLKCYQTINFYAIVIIKTNILYIM